MTTVAAIHTAMPMVEPTKELFHRFLPDVRLINIVDDSLIQEVIASGGVTKAVENRLNAYYQAAIEAGADLIFNTCSSVGDFVVEARPNTSIPIIKIDDAMAKEAVTRHTRIGVLATLETTLEPTIRLLHSFAAETGKTITVFRGLAEGAFDRVLKGDTAGHDELIRDKASEIAPNVEALVLAQGSMARMQNELAEKTGLAVYSSPESGVLSVKDYLESRSAG